MKFGISFSVLLLWWVTFNAGAQVLHNINFSYCYDGPDSLSLVVSLAKLPDAYQAAFTLHLPADRTSKDFTLAWETRTSYGDRVGSPLIVVPEVQETPGELDGWFRFERPEGASLLVGLVTDSLRRERWIFPTDIATHDKVTAYLQAGAQAITRPFLNSSEPFRIVGNSGVYTVNYFPNAFPTASPPFAESQSAVPERLLPDSVFRVDMGTELTLTNPGLYLAQQDTAGDEGIAFRVEEDYPRFTRLASLVGPFAYLCTRQEYDKLVKAVNEKKQFDRVVLGIAGSTTRARELMKNYFRRVERANILFSSYKPGWQTDRGMIYIVFGKPDEVYRFSDREIWKYSMEFNFECSFVRSSTLFDPDNFVLLRDRRLLAAWQEMIARWRKGGY